MADKIRQSNKWLMKKKTFCLITGASRGIGKTLAVCLAENFGESSVLLLIARDLAKLEATKQSVSVVAPGVKTVLRSLDLTCPDKTLYLHLISSSLAEVVHGVGDFEQAVIIHNAGTFGRQDYIENMGCPKEWAEYLSLNVVSPATLNSAFLSTFNSRNAPINVLVINITSLAAVKPMLGCGFYNTGKAAREMYFHTLAEENPSLSVLSYSPGPVDTDMLHQAHENAAHPATKHMFDDIIENHVLTCEMTTQKLLAIIREGNFVSGSRLDYFDR